ncbi:MAG TPA: hypothetical protein ENK10_03270, partial [Acidobacteria bacterium]|nr:hypothetical protein [Acidobacteriota bacterium]
MVPLECRSNSARRGIHDAQRSPTSSTELSLRPERISTFRDSRWRGPARGAQWSCKRVGTVRGRTMATRSTFRSAMRSLVPLGFSLLILTGGALEPTFAQAPTVIDLATDTNVVRIDSVDVTDELGREAVACDINGDGIQDLVVGAPGADGNNNERFSTGEVFVFFGRRGRWAGSYVADAIPHLWIIGEGGYDDLGEGLGCGDLDGDGTDDLIIGAPLADAASDLKSASGQAHIIFGDPALDGTIDLFYDPGTVIYGARADDRCGDETIPIADVNGDGRL